MVELRLVDWDVREGCFWSNGKDKYKDKGGLWLVVIEMGGELDLSKWDKGIIKIDQKTFRRLIKSGYLIKIKRKEGIIKKLERMLNQLRSFKIKSLNYLLLNPLSIFFGKGFYFILSFYY